MKLRELSLKPFAGFRALHLRFAPGLNVVLGANDVGKSSVFRALESALFLRARVSRSTREGKETLPRVIPIGGDHAQVTLSFDAQGKTHHLEKTWGQGASAALNTEGGASLAQEERVEETLRALLPAPPATFQHVLLMNQGALEGTVATLDKEREALHTLGDFLRVSADQTAGVSVDRLRAKLGERIEQAFAHWDRQANLPEKGKGIEDPWSRNKGSILEAYYAREHLRRDVREAEALESARDAKLLRLNEAQQALDTARAFVRENEAFVSSASERAALDARLAQARAECAALEKDFLAWQRAETEAELARPEVERLEPRRRALEEELRVAVAFSKQRETLARFERVRAVKNSLQEARARLAAIPPLRADDLRRLRAAVLEVDRLKAQLRGGKLQLQFHVKRDLEVSFRKDFEAERKGTMAAGKSMTVNAGGRIQLASDWFELQVTGGEGAAVDLEESVARAQDALGKLFAELKVSGLEEAEERQGKITAAQAEAQSLENEGRRALAPGEKFEDLEKAAVALGSAPEARDAEAVRAELGYLQGELEGKKRALASAESLLKNLRERTALENAATASAKLVGLKAALAPLEAQLRAAPELPASLGKLEDFLPRFRAAQADSTRLGDEIRDLSVEVAELKARLPEQSAQDLERSHRDAVKRFERELARGKALLRVEAAVRDLESGGDDLYAGFRAALEKQVSALSRGKYQRAGMAEALPTTFERNADGTHVPYAWLSSGTKDSFALALRLAMASHFLGESDGFLLVDDPLVNMDPERQKVAAEMLRDFARTRQVVLFTCHPSHAELFGGNRIEL